jgi:hypothetical protein
MTGRLPKRSARLRASVFCRIMDAYDLELADASLEHQRGRLREGIEAAVMCLVLAAATAPFALSFALALIVGAGVAGIIAIANVLSRRDAIARLALESNAYVLTDVRQYGDQLASLAERQKLAAWLYEIVSDIRSSSNLYTDDRVLRHAGLLESLAHDLSAPEARVRPSSAAACRHLLTHAASPLYNPQTAPNALPMTIEGIRRGITR